MESFYRPASAFLTAMDLYRRRATASRRFNRHKLKLRKQINRRCLSFSALNFNRIYFFAAGGAAPAPTLFNPCHDSFSCRHIHARLVLHFRHILAIHNNHDNVRIQPLCFNQLLIKAHQDITCLHLHPLLKL